MVETTSCCKVLERLFGFGDESFESSLSSYVDLLVCSCNCKGFEGYYFQNRLMGGEERAKAEHITQFHHIFHCHFQPISCVCSGKEERILALN